MQRGGSGGVLGFVVRVLLREFGRLLCDVVVVGEDEQLGGPGVGIGGEHGWDSGRLDRLVVGLELCPRHRHLETEVGVDVPVVEDPAGEARARRNAVDHVVECDRRQEALGHRVERRIAGQWLDRAVGLSACSSDPEL